MRSYKNLLSFAVLALLESALAAQPKNIILFIGDGMGFEHVKAAQYFNGSPMFFTTFPYQGQVTTYSADNAVTDSAAAGTAIATGTKVNNGVISMAFPGDGSELQTLLEYYQLQGKEVGLVTTTYLTHATPAVFGAHEPSRNNTSNIGQDILYQTHPNILLGGGANGLDPVETANAGYNVVTTLNDFINAVNTSSYTSFFAGLFGSSYMPYKYDNLESYPYPVLSEMTIAAISALSDDPDGFFLMVEGGMIDQACHSNDLAKCIYEVLDFNGAVISAYNAFSTDPETLILVTADHETGGLTVVTNNGTGVLPTVTWSTTNHTSTNVPIYAWGKNSQLVDNITLDNTQIRTVCFKDDKATNPYPSDGQTDVAANITLSWTAGIGALQHRVVVWVTDPVNPVVDTITTETQYTLTCDAGTTYYWAIDEVDTNIPGDTWGFTTGLPQQVIVSAGASWKYFDQIDSDQGDWYSTSFDDSSWSEGPAELGYGDSDEATVIDNSPIRASYYFRRSFSSEQVVKSLMLNVVRDDGCVVYLNGVEIGRSNMPEGTISWNTWAASVAEPENDWYGIALDPEVMVQQGVNVLAVSVHQTNSTSSDVSFNLELSGVVFASLIANDDSISTNEDTPIVIDVLSNDSGSEGDPLTITSVTQPANGTVIINEDQTLTYTPNPDFSETDTFIYTVEDASLNSGDATVTVTVDSTDNDPPTANNDAVSTDENTPVTIDVLSNDTDPDNDILSISLVTQPENGSAIIDGRLITYTPNPDFSGTDTFTYTAEDSGSAFHSAAVTITVIPVNDPPVANEDTISTDEDTPVTIDVLSNDTDPENDTLSVGSVTQPGNGSVIINGDGTVTYTPNPDFSGTDTFTYSASDGTIDSDSATVTVTVAPANDAPQAGDDNANTMAYTPVTIDVLANDSDIDGDPLTVIQLTQPANGVAALNTADQTVTYTPTPGFSGQDTFTYAVSDGVNTSNMATVTIEVTAVNYDAYVAAEPTVTFGVVSNTIEGTTTLNDGLTQSIDEAPNGPAAYSLSVEYTLHTQADPAGLSTPVTLNLAHTWTGGTADPLLIELLIAGTWTDITAGIADGQYQANAADILDAQGDIRIRFSDTVNKKKEAKDTLAIDLLYAQIAAGPPNQAPSIVSTAVTSAAQAALYIYDVDAADPDTADSLTYSLSTAPAGMIIDSATGQITWTPTNDQVGDNSVIVVVQDVAGASDSQSFTVTVANVNDAPAITSTPITAATVDTPYTYDVDAEDPDQADTLTYSLTAAPIGMTIAAAAGQITWTPTSDQLGDNWVTVLVTDQIASDSQTFTVTVANVNHAPTITSTPVMSAIEDEAYSYTVTAADPDTADSLVYSLTAAPVGMAIDSAAGQITWTPTNDQVGDNSVTVVVQDAAGASDSQSFMVTVANTNDAPSIISTPVTSATVETLYTYEVLASDPDAGGSLSFSLTTAPAGMSIDSGTGQISWMPASEQLGDNSVTVSVTDGTASDSQTFNVNVQAVSANTIYVASIEMSSGTAGKNVYAAATVCIVDQSGNPVAGATVFGNWTWTDSTVTSASGTSEDSNLITVRSPNMKVSGTFTFTVTNVVVDGYTYDPALNAETSDSISI